MVMIEGLLPETIVGYVIHDRCNVVLANAILPLMSNAVVDCDMDSCCDWISEADAWTRYWMLNESNTAPAGNDHCSCTPDGRRLAIKSERRSKIAAILSNLAK